MPALTVMFLVSQNQTRVDDDDAFTRSHCLRASERGYAISRVRLLMCLRVFREVVDDAMKLPGRTRA